MDPRAHDRDFLAFRDHGSAEALARVFDALAPRLLLVAGHLTRDAARAEDLVQTAFLQAMRDAAGYDGARPVDGWLAGILRHRALDERRRARLRAAEPLDEGAVPLADGADPAEVAADRELYERVVAAAMELEEPYRTVLALRIVHGLEPVAIAHALGRAPGTVRMQLKRGLDELRRTAPAYGAFAALLFGDGARGLGAVRAAVLGEAAAGAATAAGTAAAGALGAPAAAFGGWLGMKIALTVCAAALAAVALFWIGRAAPRAVDERVAAAPGAAGELAPAPDADLAPPGADPASERGELRPQELAAQEAAASPAALEVRVTFASDGSPAAGAGVYIRPEAGGFGREARADAAGRAVFAGLSPGVHAVHADRGAEPARVSWPEETRVELALPPGLALSGRVVDRDGNGVPGARIYRQNPAHHDRLQALVVAGADGAFELRDVDDGLELLARADGFQPSELRRAGARRRDDAPFELELGALGRRLRGRVVGPAGEPAAFAWVALGVDEDAREDAAGSSRDPGYQPGKPLDREGILLRADGEGRFETREAPGGHTLVLARAAGAGEEALVGWLTLWVQGDVAQELLVRLGDGAELAGVVRDAAGRAVPGLAVEAEWEGTPELGQMEDLVGPWVSDRAAVTAADGSYRLAGLLPGDYDLRVRSARRELARGERQVEPGALNVWDPVVEAPASLGVRLLDPEGAPLPGWAVLALEASGGRGHPRLAPRTDADGRARLSDLPAGEEVTLFLFAPRDRPDGLPSAMRGGVRVPPAGGDADAPLVELRLEAGELPTARLTGRLAGEDGSPLAGARLELARPDLEGAAQLATHPDGAFAFEGLAAGELRLSVRVPGGSTMFPLGTFALAPGEERDAGLLHVSSSARFTVRVLVPDGAPSGRLQVELVDPSAPRAPAADAVRWTRLDDGALQATVPAGEYLLRVWGRELAARCETVRVLAPETTLTVRCERGEPVALSIGAPAGEDAAAMTLVRLRVFDAAGTCVHDGNWMLSFGAGVERVTSPLVLHFLPGAYRVRAELEGGHAVEAELAVPRPAEAGPLLLDLR